MSSALHHISSGKSSLYFNPETMDILVDSPTAQDPRDVAGATSQQLGVFRSTQDEAEGEGTADKLVLQVSNSCNLRCRYCFVEECLTSEISLKPHFMSSGIACRAIETFLRIFKGRLNSIMFFGGEPLLNWPVIRQSVFKTLSLCKSMSVPAPRFSIVTNATLIDEEHVDFFKQHDFAVTVSCDGPRSVNDHQRLFTSRQGTFDSILCGMRLLQRRIPGLVCQVTYSARHIEQGLTPLDTAKYMQSEGINRLHMLPVLGPHTVVSISDSSNRFLFLGFKELCEYSIRSLGTDTPLILDQAMNLFHSVLTKRKRKYICTAGIDTFSVDTNGDVCPCYMADSERYKIGSVINDKDLPDNLLSAREDFTSLDRGHLAKCASCFARNLCFSCHGDAFLRTGKPGCPSAQFCAFLRGIAEGTIGGIAQLRLDDGRWGRFLSNRWEEFDRYSV